MADNISLAQEVETELRTALTYLTGNDLMSVDASRSFKELGIDSMMAIEIMAVMEKKFKITIQEKDLVKFKSIKETTDILMGYFK